MRIDVKDLHKDKDTQSALNTLNLTKPKYEDDSIALHTDLYQINMAETYWDDNMHNRRAVFDLYFRKSPFVSNGYAVFAGLDRVIDYITNFRFTNSDIDYLKNELGYEDDFLDYLKTVKFDGNIKSLAEGEIFYPNEPMLRVDAKLAQAQLIETPLLNILNFHPLIATKAARMRCAAGDDTLLDFGMRRAQEFDAAFYGARASYIGGFNGTSNVRAGKVFDIPAYGTHAHSMVQVYDDEYKAFHKFTRRHKNCIFLVDTYNTLKSGIPNAIKFAKELGNEINFLGIRLDSGDLAHLSKEARKMLDEEGFTNAKIFASNNLDEYSIQKIKEQENAIDGWGVGTKLITAYDQPALGAVYKLAALEDENKNMVDTIKLSEDPSKATTPGLKKIYRIVNAREQKIERDFIALNQEDFQDEYKGDSNLKVNELHRDIFDKGKLVYRQPNIEEMRAYCLSNLKMLRNSYKSIIQPDKYKVDLTKKCEENKLQNIRKAERNNLFKEEVIV